MSSALEQTVLPPKDVEVLAAVEKLLHSATRPLALMGSDGSRAVLPDELRVLMTDVVTALRRGQAITLAPRALRLTTQQAADLLGVSRPTLVKLLEEGKIPYETPNRHRRIQLIDLLNYQATRRGERRQALRDLTREAQESGLYDTSVEDYEAALAQARAKLV